MTPSEMRRAAFLLSRDRKAATINERRDLAAKLEAAAKMEPCAWRVQFDGKEIPMFVEHEPSQMPMTTITPLYAAPERADGGA